MAQYTFSYCRSEYDRIPYQLKVKLNKALAEANVDEETKKVLAVICASVEEAVEDLALYAQDQLQVR